MYICSDTIETEKNSLVFSDNILPYSAAASPSRFLDNRTVNQNRACFLHTFGYTEDVYRARISHRRRLLLLLLFSICYYL